MHRLTISQSARINASLIVKKQKAVQLTSSCAVFLFVIYYQPHISIMYENITLKELQALGRIDDTIRRLVIGLEKRLEFIDYRTESLGDQTIGSERVQQE